MISRQLTTYWVNKYVAVTSNVVDYCLRDPWVFQLLIIVILSHYYVLLLKLHPDTQYNNPNKKIFLFPSYLKLLLR